MKKKNETHVKKLISHLQLLSEQFFFYCESNYLMTKS